MKLGQLLDYLESEVPLTLQETYDSSGLCIGERDMEISRALIALDATESVVLEAIEIKANLIITHHPLFFQGVKKLSFADPVGRTALLAIRSHIAVYSMHTNLDKVHEGVSFQLATLLGLENLEVLRPDPGLSVPGVSEVSSPRGGLGAAGNFNRPISADDFLTLVKTRLKAKMVRHTTPPQGLIYKVGVCGGSGSDLLADAINHGAQAFLSSDFKYHQFFLADEKILIADVGHYESEQFCPLLIQEMILKKFPTFDLYLTRRSTNPVYYF